MKKLLFILPFLLLFNICYANDFVLSDGEKSYSVDLNSVKMDGDLLSFTMATENINDAYLQLTNITVNNKNKTFRLDDNTDWNSLKENIRIQKLVNYVKSKKVVPTLIDNRWAPISSKKDGTTIYFDVNKFSITHINDQFYLDCYFRLDNPKLASIAHVILNLDKEFKLNKFLSKETILYDINGKVKEKADFTDKGWQNIDGTVMMSLYGYTMIWYDKYHNWSILNSNPFTDKYWKKRIANFLISSEKFSAKDFGSILFLMPTTPNINEWAFRVELRGNDEKTYDYLNRIDFTINTKLPDKDIDESIKYAEKVYNFVFPKWANDNFLRQNIEAVKTEKLIIVDRDKIHIEFYYHDENNSIEIMIYPKANW
ncbi:MAG: hypothetical protein H6Q69_290 [Firmicutes bacterium]|nr:hypothetical protein [Bacillota bacterium]